MDQQAGRAVQAEPGRVSQRRLRAQVQRSATKKITETAFDVRVRHAQTIPLCRVSQQVFPELHVEKTHGLGAPKLMVGFVKKKKKNRAKKRHR